MPEGGSRVQLRSPRLDRRALTPCEQRVLERLLKGESNKEIADELGCAVKTVEYHVTGLLRKAGVKSRMRLALWILQRKAQ